MEWTEGRKLASVTYNNKETAYEYNHEGLRIKKTLSDGSYILYDIVDGVYVGETRYNASGSVAVYIRYILDEGNAPVGISLWYPATGGWTDYHFVKNLQGDVLEVYKVSDGSLAASYTYDSWGNILSQSGDLATLNPFRYRSYYYDTQTWFYYLQSRYYDPAIGRFINADTFTSTGQGITGNNMFAYCGNNPITRVDHDGQAWETVFDILSLGSSIAGVAVNPADPWAWLALAGDIADVAIPFVGGLGEAAKALKVVSEAAGYAEDAADIIEITTNTLQVISDASKTLNPGNNCVYVAYTADGLLEYVGITNDFNRRQKEWEGIREIEKLVPNVDRAGARYVEQTVITLFGMSKNGGIPSNSINSIGPRGSKYAGYIEFISDLLD